MSRALLGAKSGHGKSWLCQQRVEKEIPNYPIVVLADYKDEYRGLAKAGLAKWLGVGQSEAGLSVADWQELLRENRTLVVARSVTEETWQEVVARISRALRDMPKDSLIVIDEAHFVAPQRGSYPEEIEGLATTGRGEGVSSMWVTQRLAKLDETVVSQADMRILGAFTNKNDLGKIEGVVPYPVEVHNRTLEPAEIPRTPDEITDPPVSKFEQDGQTVGSEWVWSDDSGTIRWVDTRNLSMDSTHYGPEGNSLTIPE